MTTIRLGRANIVGGTLLGVIACALGVWAGVTVHDVGLIVLSTALLLPIMGISWAMLRFQITWDDNELAITTTTTRTVPWSQVTSVDAQGTGVGKFVMWVDAIKLGSGESKIHIPVGALRKSDRELFMDAVRKHAGKGRLPDVKPVQAYLSKRNQFDLRGKRPAWATFVLVIGVWGFLICALVAGKPGWWYMGLVGIGLLALTVKVYLRTPVKGGSENS